MRNILIVLVLALALALPLPALAARELPKQLTFKAFAERDARSAKRDDAACATEACQGKRLEFRYVVYVGKEIYCYWDEKRADTGRDFDALAAEIEAGITDQTSPTDYYVALRRWASLFHDGHVNVLLKADHSDIEIYTAPLRLQVYGAATADERVFVSEVLDTDAVQAGDEVLSIDGLPIRQALDQAELATSGSTKRMRRFFGSRRLVDVMGYELGAKPLKLSLSRGTGAPFEVTLHRSIEVAPQLVTPPTAAASTGAELFKAMVLPGGLGYLRIDAFSGTQSFFLLDQLMRRLAGTRGLVIDLRKNGGGDQSGNSIIAKLITSPVIRYATAERMSGYLFHARPTYQFLPVQPGALFSDWHDLAVQPSADRSYVGKPVIALTSNYCFSACDTFTVGLKTNKLATVVGEATAGGTGTPLVFDLPVSGHQFRYSVVRGRTPDGKPIEGAGTQPDVELKPSFQDRGRVDSQLAGVLGILGAQVGGGAVDAFSLASEVSTRFGSVWAQGFDLSPTRSEDARLQQIATHDEL
jgi:carboxyl-terminal processing protease